MKTRTIFLSFLGLILLAVSLFSQSGLFLFFGVAVTLAAFFSIFDGRD